MLPPIDSLVWAPTAPSDPALYTQQRVVAHVDSTHKPASPTSRAAVGVRLASGAHLPLPACHRVNPSSDPRYSDYVDRPLDPEAPHPYAIAEFAYQQMRLRGQSQSIVVSGESGAGKTENAKVLLSYLLPEIVENIRTSQCTEDADPSR